MTMTTQTALQTTIETTTNILTTNYSPLIKNTMKKVFFYVAAAMTMLAGCQKAELNQTQTPVDDTTPVAMQLGAASPSFTLTKASIDEWNQTPVFVYGLQNGKEGITPVFENYSTVVPGEGNAVLEIYQDAEKQAPYFYSEGFTYDFYGYHVGQATIEGETAVVDGEVSFEVTFDGSNDVMYAYANKAEDIKKDPTRNVREADAYSAWAARRNVQPTLVFEHALTQFVFKVRGMNEKSKNVTIKSIKVQSVDNGTLTVVGQELGFVPADVDATTLVLKNADDTEFAAATVVPNETFTAGGAGASLMVAPGMESLHVAVEMWNNQFDIDLDDYIFDAAASAVRKTNSAESAGLTAFEAGTAYNIYINVYGPEEIEITAELTKWKEGGDYTYDPDATRPDGSASTFVNANLTGSTATTLAYSIQASEDIAALQAALKNKSTGVQTAWKDVVLTKGVVKGTVSFEGLTEGEQYELLVQTKTDLADEFEEYKDVDGKKLDVTAAPSTTTVSTSGLVTSEEDFEEGGICFGKLTYYEESTPQTLPWLAVRLAAAVKHMHVVVEHGTFYKELDFEATGEGASLLTLNAEELGTELTPGNWTVTVNGAKSVINVPEPYVFKVLSSGMITDQASFDEWTVGTSLEDKWDAGTQSTLPWLAVKFTPTKVLTVNAYCAGYSKTIEFKKDVEFSLLTLNAEELGKEILPGQTWNLEVNGVAVNIVVPLDVKRAFLVNNVTTYKSLPAEYIQQYGNWGTPGLAESLPWLAVELNTAIQVANWKVAFNGKVVAADTWKKADGSDITLVTFSEDEIGTEIVAGTWTVTLNGTAVDIVVE